MIEAGEYVREATFLDKDEEEKQEVVLKLTGPPRKHAPRFKTENLPSGKDM